MHLAPAAQWEGQNPSVLVLWWHLWPRPSPACDAHLTGTGRCVWHTVTALFTRLTPSGSLAKGLKQSEAAAEDRGLHSLIPLGLRWQPGTSSEWRDGQRTRFMKRTWWREWQQRGAKSEDGEGVIKRSGGEVMMKRSDESRCDVNALWRRCDQKGEMEWVWWKRMRQRKVWLVLWWHYGVMEKVWSEGNDGMGIMKKDREDAMERTDVW